MRCIPLGVLVFSRGVVCVRLAGLPAKAPQWANSPSSEADYNACETLRTEHFDQKAWPAAGAGEDAGATPGALVEASSSEAWGGASRLLASGLVAAGRGPRGAPPPPQSTGALYALPIGVPPAPIERVVPAREERLLAQERGSAFEEMGAALVRRAVPGELFERSVRKATKLAVRDAAMMGLLRGKPGIDSFIAEERDGSQIGLLRQNEQAAMDLAERFGELERLEQGGLPFMPLRESLALLADLLRGVESLNSKRVVHLDLAGGTAISLVPDATGERHAVIRELGQSACIIGPTDKALSCKYFAEPAGSAASRAPEHRAISNNVWQAGLIFAKMCLGAYPTDEAARGGEEGVPRTRWRPQERFVVADVSPDFAATYPAVAELIEGMLEPSPGDRWSVQRALKATEELLGTYSMEASAPAADARI